MGLDGQADDAAKAAYFNETYYGYNRSRSYSRTPAQGLDPLKKDAKSGGYILST